MTSSKKKPRPFPPIPDIPEHQPFSWLDKDLRTDQAAQCIAFTLDMCQGIYKGLAMLHANHLAQEHCDPDCPPPLNACDVDLMLRWMMGSTEAVLDKSETSVNYLNDLIARQRPTNR
ncbi:hypothetical protein [Paraherbaspirillum soli]|uniref:Uncharacterized protein n=1 Tax=Paraherbaspirillum soli TaxID=631222 RepID=A0ABW0M903_9BURK